MLLAADLVLKVSNSETEVQLLEKMSNKLASN